MIRLSFSRKLSAFLSSIAPGIFLIGYNIGTGSITTMASAGAGFGMTLVWPLFISCIFTFVLIITFGRFTAVTGKTAIHGFREHFGNTLALIVLYSILISEWIACIGIMGVVTQVIQEWSRPVITSGEGLSPILSATILGAILYFLFWNGQQRFFEKILTIFVAIMGISFIVTMFMVIPDPGEIIRGLIPHLPKDPETETLMAGMAGTTMGGSLFIARSILVQEKGWTVRDLKKEKRDALISSSFMFILSVSVMACAAGTLYVRGLSVHNAIDMVRLLEPLAGRFAISIFVAGIVSAGLSSLFPIIILAPWLFADYRNRSRNMSSKTSRFLVFIGVILGLVIPVFGGHPVSLMITSTALVAVSTPLVIILMLILVNQKKLMGIYRANRLLNFSLILISLFTTVMAVFGIIGIIDKLSRVF